MQHLDMPPLRLCYSRRNEKLLHFFLEALKGYLRNQKTWDDEKLLSWKSGMPENWGEMSQPTELLFPILCSFTFQKLHDFKNSDLFPLDLAHTFHEG